MTKRNYNQIDLRWKEKENIENNIFKLILKEFD